MKYSLGLDLGITSIGWALLLKDDDDNLQRIEDIGVIIFEQLEDKDGRLENAKRREKRGQRRLKRRKKLRLKEASDYFKKEWGINFFELNFKKIGNPFELKIKGISEKLTREELAIAIYHYIKYRGFKSNRKVEDKNSEGALLERFAKVDTELKEQNLTITQYLWNIFSSLPKNEARIHNSSDNYRFSSTRQMYIDEIVQLLDKQIEFGVVDKSFKDFILDEKKGLFTRQRSFSEGPNSSSPFGAKDGISLIEKMMGKCVFDKKIRAPKNAFSAESFVLLSFLNNMKIADGENFNYRKLTPKEIEKVYEFAKTVETLTYNNIFKILNIKPTKIKGLESTKKQYIDNMNKFKKDKKIEGNQELTKIQYDEFKKFSLKKLFDTKTVSLNGFHTQKKIFEKYVGANNNLSLSLKEEINNFLSNNYNFDLISYILTTRKVDDEIIKECKERGYSKEFAEIICTMPSIATTINLSTDICKLLIPELLKGNEYDKAMENIGYNHSVTNEDIEKYQFLPSIEECCNKLNEQLTNVNVKHTLVQLRKLLNAIIKKYGYIDQINIELARELAKNHKDRIQILYDQRDSMDDNIQTKELLMKKYPHFFSNFKAVKAIDVLKYRLYLEQNGKCAYSNVKISENQIFDDNICQIDHIMPYSKTFEDRAFNKVLVFSRYNQEKRDRLPYEAFKNSKWEKIMEFINDPFIKISQKKKEILLMKELNYEEWKERNLNDTKYISRLAMKIIKSFLQPTICIAVAGSMTSMMKKCYGLNDITHSFISEDYKKQSDFSINFEEIEFSNDSITFSLINNKTNEKRKVSLKIINKKILSTDEINLNKSIEYFIKNQNKLYDEIKYAITNKNTILNISNYIMKGIVESRDINQSFLYDMMLNIFTKIQIIISQENIKKDRKNHLHHALDAAIIACADQKIRQKITKYAKHIDFSYDEETGEIVRKKPQLELPYKDFRKEIIYRVYERDHGILINKLKPLSNYQDFEFKNSNVHVLYPVRSTKKNIKGAFTEETLFGSKRGKITKKISVNDINIKNIDTIIDQKNGQKAVYESIKQWFDDKIEKEKNKNDKKISEYPILQGKGNYIKTVRILETKDARKRVRLKGNIYAKNTECIRIDVYKKKGTENYFIVPISYFQLVKEKQNMEIIYEISWGQSENRDFITADKLKNEYIKQFSIPKYSLIEVEMSENRKGLAYTVGFTSGQIEIKSILGDDFDLIKSRIPGAGSDRVRITVSTIKNIKVRNISILGKIS
ncbi:MAG: type II CRISPR RNA-guided endonuclease Cas9 [Fusobacteriaceae bacterium]|jgi:CRISPR-associated endonuclease Csn1|nr:type II CRISPR RNA-guided endonuclease Cas9 [Fusobacteriaceae bacterium]